MTMQLSEEFKRAIEQRALVRSSERVRIVNSAAGTPHKGAWLFDFRAVMLEPKWLDAYAEIFWEKHGHRYPFQVGGMETAGIPLVTAIVMKGVERKTPVNGFFIRKSRKREGLMKAIEGTLTNEPVILVDDLINSGDSILKQIEILEDVGAEVSAVFAVLCFRASESYNHLRQKGALVEWLFTLEDFGLPLQKTVDRISREFSVVWRKKPTNQPSFEYVIQKSAPVADDKRVYRGTDSGSMQALEQTTGDIAWSFEIGKHPFGKGIFSSPALHEGILYFGAYDGNVYALEAESGAMRWKFEEADWVGSSPAIAANLGLLYIGLEFGLLNKRGGIAAIEMKSGKKTWEDRTPALTHGSPLYIQEEGLVVVGSNDGVVYAYDAKTGTKKWTYQTGGDIKTRPAYSPEHRLVYVPSMDSKLYALAAADGSPRWALQTGSGIYSNPLVLKNSVYMASLDKTLYRLDAESGREQATFETGGRIFASPVFADSSLWIGSNDGKLYELDPETLKQRGSFQCSERIVNAVAYNGATRRLFVPTVANELYCLERKASEAAPSTH
jgi:outer membrane protein assembly factor BamB/adenine/guanine phosphoribosyltransferase-like PRPP-binding protein